MFAYSNDPWSPVYLVTVNVYINQEVNSVGAVAGITAVGYLAGSSIAKSDIASKIGAKFTLSGHTFDKQFLSVGDWFFGSKPY